MSNFFFWKISHRCLRTGTLLSLLFTMLHPVEKFMCCLAEQCVVEWPLLDSLLLKPREVVVLQPVLIVTMRPMMPLLKKVWLFVLSTRGDQVNTRFCYPRHEQLRSLPWSTCVRCCTCSTHNSGRKSQRNVDAYSRVKLPFVLLMSSLCAVIMSCAQFYLVTADFHCSLFIMRICRWQSLPSLFGYFFSVGVCVQRDRSERGKRVGSSLGESRDQR